MTIGFTGPRAGMSTAQARELVVQLHRFAASTLHHGVCMGADVQAHAAGRQLGLWIVGHPPIAAGLRADVDCDEWREPKEYLTRNRALVQETRVLIATPDGPERLRSGTWSTIRYAHRLHQPLVIIRPAGDIESFWID